MNNQATKFKRELPPCRIFTIYALFFIVGIGFASYFIIKPDFIVALLIVLSLLLAGLINFFLKNYWFYLASFALIFLFAGFYYYSLFNQSHSVNLPYGQELTLEGKIIKRPDVDYVKQQVTIEILSAEQNGQKVNAIAGSNLLVKLPHYPSVYYGDTLKLTGKIEQPQNFADFDYRQYLRRYLIYGVVNNPRTIAVLPVELSAKDKIVKFIYNIPWHFETAINQTLPEPQASLASGILLGSKRNMPEELTQALSRASLTHIIALSGYNITIIVAILSSLLLGYLGKRPIFWLSLIFITLFVFMTGLSSSALRAAIFSMLIIYGRTLGRSGDMTNLMLLAALAMLLINPYVLADDVGFQLSFLAFAGLIYLTPIVEKILSQKTNLSKTLVKIIAETLGAQIAVFPLIMALFGTVSLIGPLANLLVVWIIPFAMLGSFLVGIGALIYGPLGKLIIFLAWPILSYIINMTDLCAKIPFAAINLGKGNLLLELLFFILIVFFALYYNKKYQLKLLR